MPLATAAPSATRCLHHDPPATPTSFFARRRRLLFTVIAALAALAVAAATANGWLLMRWDGPVQQLVEDNRGDDWNTLFRLASRLGSTIVVLTVGPLLALLTWRRCRAVSIAVLLATFARPLLEFTIKELVGRERPDLNQLVDGNGPSFPSGHPMAAVALWGLLPLVVGLFTDRRALWWATTAISGFMIAAISASRVYLGVHWLSDVIAGLLVGALFLIGVEWTVQRAHALPNACTRHGHPIRTRA